MKHAKLILTTGPGLDPTPNGDILVLDWEHKRILDKYRYTHRVHEQTRKGLQGASWNENGLLVATECELLEFTMDPLNLKSSKSFPFLNDIHFVAAHNDRFWVCNTGLDCIEELDHQWQVVKTHDLLGSPGRRLRYAINSFRESVRSSYHQLRGWKKPYAHLAHRPRFRNMRKLLRANAFRRNGCELRFSFFRPHILHPNHLLPLDGDLWITLSFTGELLSLGSGRILANGLGRPHDGIVAGDEHYLTDAKSNRLIVHEFDSQGPSLLKRKVAKTLTQSSSEGFLRGVAVIEDRVFVGLSARRGASERYSRACIVALDRNTLETLDEWVIPEEYGKMVFSILDATNVYA